MTTKRRTKTTQKATPKTEAKRPTKLSLLAEALARPDGASLEELMAATGWQAHSVRGALAGSLKKKGYAISSEKTESGERRYRITGRAS